MICEIINPSDKYTLITDDFKLAAVAVAILGNGKYGLKNIDGDESSPVLFGWESWFQEQGIEDLSKYIDDHKTDIAMILDTVLIGDRSDVENTLPLIAEDQRQKWLDDRHDRKRSSMNDIGKAAKSIAKALRSGD